MSADTPEEVHELFAKCFSAGDLEGLLALYEPGATLAPRTGAVLNGLVDIREALIGFLALKPQFELQLQRTFQAGDIALLFSKWKLTEINPKGGVIERSGQTTDVVRRQPDGTWRLIIDVPYGSEAANE